MINGEFNGISREDLKAIIDNIDAETDIPKNVKSKLKNVGYLDELVNQIVRTRKQFSIKIPVVHEIVANALFGCDVGQGEPYLVEGKTLYTMTDKNLLIKICKEIYRSEYYIENNHIYKKITYGDDLEEKLIALLLEISLYVDKIQHQGIKTLNNESRRHLQAYYDTLHKLNDIYDLLNEFDECNLLVPYCRKKITKKTNKFKKNLKKNEIIENLRIELKNFR